MLARIASVVGCPVESFQDGSAPDGAAAQAAELLRHWLSIRPEDRGKVLDFARMLADRDERV